MFSGRSLCRAVSFAGFLTLWRVGLLFAGELSLKDLRFAQATIRLKKKEIRWAVMKDGGDSTVGVCWVGCRNGF